MKHILLYVSERKPYVDELVKRMPVIEAYTYPNTNVHDAFIENMSRVGSDSVLAFEDDIILSSKFEQIAYPFIESNQNDIINFFSMKRDAYLGTRKRRISDFAWTQCVYLPSGFAAGLVKWYPSWAGRNQYRGAQDYLIRDYARHIRIKSYWIHEPNLVQHLPIISAINKTRSTCRQSPTFLP